jgi:hypothetical protein
MINRYALTPLRPLRSAATKSVEDATPTDDGDHAATAQAIIRAGKIRRGEIEPDQPNMSEAAKAILAAGCRRRGEQV